MGCNSEIDSDCSGNQFPLHPVTLAAYAIDRTEVTAETYRAWCVDGLPLVPEASSGTCTPKADANYDPGNGRLAHPINGVEWYQAQSYCAHANKRLCTEAEWERAARGGCETVAGDCAAMVRTYPWGDGPATCDQAVIRESDAAPAGCGQGTTAVVGKQARGHQPIRRAGHGRQRL